MARSRITLDGLPHSEIFGSKPVCGSPKLIAAYHVLHRRPAPRHPPYALSSLTTTSTLLEICSDLLMRLRLRAGRWSPPSAAPTYLKVGMHTFARALLLCPITL